MRTTRVRNAGIVRMLALLFVLAMVAAACGGGDDSSGSADDGDGGPTTGDVTEDTTPAEGPARGGKVIYALEAETSGGFCLPESQLAIAGIQVARTIFDTLTKPVASGEFIPWLAESIEPNADFTEWTIKVREGVKFHDGSDLTGQVVQNNIDAWRGAYEGRSPLLFIFVMDNIAGTELVDPMTVKVTTKVPWPALPAFLYASGRLGIIAQAQLDDPDTCDRNLIGTGPFMQDDWVVNDHFSAVRNDNWWYADLAGEDLPYLDAIEFRPIIRGPDRLRAFEAGDIDAGHFSGGRQLAEMRPMAEAGEINYIESDQWSETSYSMINESVPPFDNINARRALQYSIDRQSLIDIVNGGVGTPASGPFAPGAPGFLEDAGWPAADPDRAREFAEAYTAETGLPFSFTLTSSADPDTLEIAQTVQQFWQDIGAQVSLEQIADQSQLINNAIGGDFQIVLWRNHPGSDPDTQYVWWHSGSPVNFGRINDPELDTLLVDGRSELDPDARVTIYEDLNRRFADQAHNLWAWWTIWAVPTKPAVHGVLGPDLYTGDAPFPGLAVGHETFGMWVDGGGS